MSAARLLAPLTPVWAAAVRLRAALYRRGVMRQHRLPVPVVSVGNLTFGGTGKTPTVIALVRDLVRRGRHPAVLTRGYRGRGPHPLLLVGPEPGIAPAAAGDEPLELAGRLPGVPIVVDPNRIRGAGVAVQHGADVVVLDDGFQHLAVERDLDLVLVDAGDPWGGGLLPPHGRLREPLSALQRATAILVTKLPDPAGPPLDRLRREAAAVAPALPVLGARLQPARVRTPDGHRPPEILAGRRVLAAAAVGRPEGFAEVLRGLGAEVSGTRWYPDHCAWPPAEVAELASAAASLDAELVVTAKDAVKLPPGHSAWVLEVDMVPVVGDWDALWATAPGVLR